MVLAALKLLCFLCRKVSIGRVDIFTPITLYFSSTNAGEERTAAFRELVQLSKEPICIDADLSCQLGRLMSRSAKSRPSDASITKTI